jgi:anti-anti-sigma factor
VTIAGSVCFGTFDIEGLVIGTATPSLEPTVRRAVDPDADTQLTVNIVVDGARSVVAVRGEIDLATAPLLEATVKAVIDQGCTQVVFDASGVDFMDCSGLRSVLGLAERLGRRGGALVIRTPSAQVTRLLDLSGVDAIVPVDQPAASAPDGDDGLLATALDREATSSAGTDAIEAALSAVVVLAAASIMGADGASLTLVRHGRLVTAAATGDNVVELDHRQYESAQGPCVDAATHGRRFSIESAEDEQRWSSFIPHLIERGLHSVLSTPLVTAAGPVGSLNLYARPTDAFDIDGHALASVFAAQAATVVTHGALEHSADQFTRRLQAALEDRAVIAQAQGVLMAQTGVSAEEAHTALRSTSQAADVPLVEAAHGVMAFTKAPGHA